MSVSEDRNEALVTWVRGRARANEKPGLLHLLGLDPDKNYREERSGTVRGGDELMFRGLPLPPVNGDDRALQFHLTAE